MRRRLALLATGLLVASTGAAAADPGHERPEITVFRFVDTPVKAGTDETLKVVAHDPDSWISEIQVQWEDVSGNGGVVFAHTYCVQDPDYSDPGTPARLKIPIYFDQPGSYHVEARAISEIECRGGNEKRTSRTLEMDVVARDPSKTATDPDDASGAFDIASMEQTQESSETSATTELVHRITMFEPWTNDQLAGPAYIELYFDLDGDTGEYERVMTVDLDEDDGTVRASMINARTGQGRGYAAVSRPDDRTIQIAFPPLLLSEGIDDYRWYAYMDSGAIELCAPADPCTDRAPGDAWMRHRI